jgi:cell fate (sporulation/competence/biofilm development) regulator YmcA (YheA/YmcA/DUF963 family)
MNEEDKTKSRVKELYETRVDKDLFVNDATLELLSKRIEADVKKGFFKSIGAPIGGAGIIAILYVLFSWIPSQLGQMIESMPGIRQTIQASVIDYLGDEDKGKKFILDQVDLNSEKFVSKSVNDYMSSEKMAHTLQNIIDEKTSAYYKSEESAKLVEQAIKSHMASEAVRQQIREAVDKALSPVLGSLSRDIEEQFSSLVFDLPELAGTKQINKESFQDLMRFLSSSQVSDIKKSASPIVLTIAIGHGHYMVPIIEAYILKLKRAFEKQFKYVAILDQEEKFLALIPSMSFLDAVNEDRSLIDLLNGSEGEAAFASFRDRFGEAAMRRIQTNDVVKDVLRMSLWEARPYSEYVGVTGGTGRLVGITSRRKIIDGCLDQISG